MVAIEGRDLPLPGQEPILDTIERAIRLIVFGLILAITMIPLLCIVLCPLALVGGLLFDSNGGTVSLILGWTFFALTVGLAFVTYQLVGQTRYFITGDFGGSLNPATLFRTVRFNLTDWLLAALFPILISLGSALLRELLIDPITDDQWLSYAINTVLTIPIAIYTTLVQFHLAGQAYRLSQPSTQAAAF